MHLGQWDVSQDPIQQTVLIDLIEIRIMHISNNSSTGMAAVVIAIAHKHAFCFQEQNW